jgi:hypothetical protein
MKKNKTRKDWQSGHGMVPGCGKQRNMEGKAAQGVTSSGMPV